MRLRRRQQGAPPVAHPVLSVGVFDNRGLGPVPPSAAIRVYRRVRNSTSPWLSFERLDAAAYAAEQGDSLDVLLVVRDAFAAADVQPAMARARADGSRVLVDVDDDLFTDHATRRLVDQGYSAARLGGLETVLGRADAVTVSTPYLADLVRPRTEARVTVLPNELDPLLWATDQPELVSEVDPDEVRILYMGSKTHAGDLALINRLPAALEDRLDRPVALELVGVTPGALPPGARRLVPDKPNYAGFVRWLRARRSRWHVAVAPLADTPFNASKSDLKLLEYAALGLRTVASPAGPYVGAPEELATHAHTLREWTEATARLLERGPDLAAQAWVLENRTMQPHSLAAWEETLVGATGVATPGEGRAGRSRNRS